LVSSLATRTWPRAGQLELQRQTIDIAEAIEEVLFSIKPHSEAKSISIETRTRQVTTLDADRLRLKQILFNLLNNAVKFTPDGGRIHVDALRRNGVVEISVRDNGIGIPKELHEFVFDKFHQVRQTANGVREGTGLGLAITKALVEQHDGNLRLESEPGKGSTFTFTIPVKATVTQAKVGREQCDSR